VNRVIGPEGHPIDPFGDAHTGQLAGEGLFVDVGVVENARRQDLPTRSEDLPPVGIVLPAGVGVLDSHGKIESVVDASDLDVDHVRLAGPAGGRPQGQQHQQDWKGDSHVFHHLLL
jgi:hypothetical protein